MPDTPERSASSPSVTPSVNTRTGAARPTYIVDESGIPHCTDPKPHQHSSLEAPLVCDLARELYGFPRKLLDQVNEAFPGNSGPCGLCGDTILGGRHRVIDAIRERLVAGEGDEAVEDYDLPWAWAAVAVAASYEHTEALKRQRRAARKLARDRSQEIGHDETCRHD